MLALKVTAVRVKERQQNFPLAILFLAFKVNRPCGKPTAQPTRSSSGPNRQGTPEQALSPLLRSSICHSTYLHMPIQVCMPASTRASSHACLHPHMHP